MLTAPRVALILLMLPFGGCAYLRPSNDPPRDVVTKHWVEVENAHSHPGVQKSTIEGLAAVLNGQCPPEPAPTSKPLNILSLSAGGKYAAFSAGVVTGWTANGSRPSFDVVTGVSAGSIVALYAFLGPQYDPKLTHFFTETSQRDLYRTRPLVGLAFFGSLALPHGLERTINAEINDTTLAEIRAAHAAGRRLFIATLNVHSKKLCVWDVGAIASCQRPDAGELVRKIFLASSAVPGLLPPVEFDVVVDGVRYTELHSDGGPVTQTFVRFGPCAVPKPGTKWLAGSQLYCIAAGKIEPDPIIGRLNIAQRIGGSLSAALYALYKEELNTLYSLCVTSGMRFNLASIPQDVELDTNSTRFRASEMRPLYTMGHQMARHGMMWRDRPPGSSNNEEQSPRSGLMFTTTPCP